MRRTIASLLAAAECFSVVAVGVPSSYALETDSYEIVEQLESNGQSDRAELTAPDSYATEQTQIQDEPQTVTPADAARLGAEAAAKYADEAGLAADEAENAAFETETILDAQELYEDRLNAASAASSRAADASRRAADYAYRAADEARWAAEAVEVAARSADWADAEYARIAADSDMAAEAADRAAEEAALTAEEAALTAEKAAAAQAAARDAENIERLFSEILVIKDGTKDAAVITEEATNRVPIVIKDMTTSRNDTEEKIQAEEQTQTEEQTKLAAEAAAQEADQATQEAAIASENAAIANENAARAAEETINKAEAARQAEENARFLAEEYDRAYASATEAVAQAERAYAEANRAQAAADRAAAAVAEAEAKLPVEEPVVEETSAADETNDGSAEGVTEEPSLIEEVPGESAETVLTEETPAPEEKEELIAEQPASDTLLQSAAPQGLEAQPLLTLGGDQDETPTGTEGEGSTDPAGNTDPVGNTDPTDNTVPKALELTYNGEEQALLAADAGAFKYRLGEDGEFSTDIPTAKNAGNYTIYYIGSDDEIPSDLSDHSLTVTIAKASATVKAENKSKIYGEEDDPALTAMMCGLFGEDTMPEPSLSREAGDGVGEYAITASGVTELDNYTVTYEPGIFRILPKPVTVTADAMSKPYGDADPELTATVEGLLDGETEISFSLARAEGEEVDTYVITPDGEKEQGNYTITYVPNTFTITMRPVTVTADA